MFQIGLTLPTGLVTCERSFSALRLIETRLNNEDVEDEELLCNTNDLQILLFFYIAK